MRRQLTRIALFCILSCLQIQQSNSAEPTKADAMFFEAKIRPLLVEHCQNCHGPEKQKGKLRLDSRASMLAGGGTGPAIVPGKPEKSLLVETINYQGYEMPPTGQLSKKKRDLFIEWIRRGAPWPGSDGKAHTPVRKHTEITAEDKAYWAFQPIQKPSVPNKGAHSDSPNPVDRFIAARLAEKNIAPNTKATRRQLIRRAYFDLIGLPPAPQEVQQFLHDESVDAYEKVIDTLLARPEYGERWGRHWLDVVRFAQTNGYERDNEKPFAWRYRDYVIAAFNDDKPYDRFVMEQLAGDELSDASPETRTATAFYRLGVWDDEPDDPRQAVFDELDDILSSTGAAFLGLTLGCARCHEHKFDPISQADYYELLAFLRNIKPYANKGPSLTTAQFLPITPDHKFQQIIGQYNTTKADLVTRIEAETDDSERKILQGKLRKLKLTGLEWTLGITEQGVNVPATHLLIRGNAGTPGKAVEPAFLNVLGGEKPKIKSHNDPHYPTSGRRLALARWIASPDNPLTARVIVNRIWHYHFGKGLVKTTSDFGKAGLPPTHPRLLDWLAAEFLERGWSIKNLHKIIMLSETYQRASTNTNPAALKADPGNDFYWRGQLRRLEAEAIRDTILSISGTLNSEKGGRGYFPQLSGEVLAGASKPGFGWEISPETQRNRRSVYTFIKRTIMAPLLDSFDYTNTAQPFAERPSTTVAPQALMLLNDQFMHKQADHLSRRLRAEAGTKRKDQIQFAYQLAFNRNPSDAEQIALANYYQRQLKAYQSLRERITFRPEMPLSLYAPYLERLKPEHFLTGPRNGWTYHKGRWTGGYSGIKSVDLQNSPFSLWNGLTFENGTISTRLQLQQATELAALLFRARTKEDRFVGYELLVDPRRNKLILNRHTDKVTKLTEHKLPPEAKFDLVIHVNQKRIRVDLNNRQNVLDFTDPDPIQQGGRFGVRVWGDACALDALTIRTDKLSVQPAVQQVVLSDSPKVEQKTWSFYQGQWRRDKDILIVDAHPGAKVVSQEHNLTDGTLEADIKLLDNKGDVGLLVRANKPTNGVDALQAYNINLKAGLVRLGKHNNNWRQLAQSKYKIEAGRWHNVKARMDGNRIRIYVDQSTKPVIDYTDAQPIHSGAVGFRTYQNAAAFRNLKILEDKQFQVVALPELNSNPNKTVKLSPMPNRAPQQALQSLCLLILNLNELIYID